MGKYLEGATGYSKFPMRSPFYISPNKIAEFSIATKLYLIGAIASFEVTAQHTLVFRQDASNNVSPD